MPGLTRAVSTNLAALKLSESINSMFKWYQRAQICYVYLSDQEPADDIIQKSCRWFSRGWTLQELLAPPKIEFYNREWSNIGNKENLSGTLASIARIPESVIRGEEAIKSYSVAQRMSWAAGRKTTRLEDRAYSLLGIFDIHMPMLYGEGLRAFRRLQEEIIKQTDDFSILAWKSTSCDGSGCSPLTTSPDPFYDSHAISKAPLFVMGFSTSNKGINIVQKRLFLYPWDDCGTKTTRYMLEVGRLEIDDVYALHPGEETWIWDIYSRILPSASNISLEVKRTLYMTRPHDFFIVEVGGDTQGSLAEALQRQHNFHGAIRISMCNGINLQPKSPIPTAAYDHATGLCFCPQGIGVGFFACSFTARLGPSCFQFGLLLASPLPREDPV